MALANLAQVNKALMHGLLLVPSMFVLRLLNLFPKQFSLTPVSGGTILVNVYKIIL